MFFHASQRGGRKKRKGVLYTLGALLLTLTVACGGGPKNKLTPRLTEVKRLAAEGSYWFERGCFKRAKRYFYQALEASRLVDNLEEMVRAYNNLGAVALVQDHYVEASEHLQKSLEFNSLLQSAREEAFALGNLGSLAYEAGRYQEAEELWEKALVVAEKNPQKSGFAMHLNNLGMLRRKQGRLEEAESLFKRALARAENSGYRPTMANSHVQLGLVAEARGDFASAGKQLRRALEIDRAAENAFGIAQDLEQIGRLHQLQQLWQKAFFDLDRAIRLYGALGKMENVSQLYNLLEINKIQGGVPESLEPYEGLLVPPDEFWVSPLCK
jgi:tetratricopeptide (TPR) repeat protein